MKASLKQVIDGWKRDYDASKSAFMMSVGALGISQAFQVEGDRLMRAETMKSISLTLWEAYEHVPDDAAKTFLDGFANGLRDGVMSTQEREGSALWMAIDNLGIQATVDAILEIQAHRNMLGK